MIEDRETSGPMPDPLDAAERPDRPERPDPAEKAAHAKVGREDWLGLAERVLIEEGVAQIKILGLARRLEVSRSSFYWYFESRDDLLAQLLDRWEGRNTAAILERAGKPAPTIFAAILNIFECWVDPALFDPQLDFAVREWARRSETVRARLDRADEARVDALRDMFARHGYTPTDAFIRARVVYFMQIGYYALVESEPLEDRLSYTRAYLEAFTGRAPSEAEIAESKAAIAALIAAREAG